MHGACMDYAWSSYEGLGSHSMGMLSTMRIPVRRVCMDYAWSMHGLCIDYALTMHCLCIA